MGSNILRRSCGIVIRTLAAALLLVLLSAPSRVYADEMPALSKTKLSMVQYRQKKLHLSGAEDGQVVWRSSDKKVAKVNSGGVVTAKEPGRCEITAEYEGNSYVCLVKVKALKLSRTKLTIAKFHTETLTLNNRYLKKVKWSSSNPKVATVSKSGQVRGKNKGSCTITAKYKTTELQCRVKVRYPSYELLQETTPVSESRGSIVLAGSSSIARWQTAVSAFRPYEALNMGIYNSTVEDWMGWYQGLITAYKPSAVVLYIGSNDIRNGNNGISGAVNAANTINLIIRMLQKLPTETQIFYISLIPCRARPGAWEEIQKSNRIMEWYCGEHPRVTYIDLRSSFVTSSGKPRSSLFLKDRMHPNHEGFKIWNKTVVPVVKSKLERK